MGAAAILGILALAITGFVHLAELKTLSALASSTEAVGQSGLPEAVRSQLVLRMNDRDFYGYLIGHSILTVALVFFAYQILKIAERMLLPAWWINYVLIRRPFFAN